MFFSYRLLSLLPILSRFWNQSILAEDRIYFFTGAGIKLRQYADMLLSVTSVDAISVTDLALCHIHFRHPLLSTSGPSVQKFLKRKKREPKISPKPALSLQNIQFMYRLLQKIYRMEFCFKKSIHRMHIIQKQALKKNRSYILQMVYLIIHVTLKIWWHDLPCKILAAHNTEKIQTINYVFSG